MVWILQEGAVSVKRKNNSEEWCGWAMKMNLQSPLLAVVGSLVVGGAVVGAGVVVGGAVVGAGVVVGGAVVGAGVVGGVVPLGVHTWLRLNSVSGPFVVAVALRRVSAVGVNT